MFLACFVSESNCTSSLGQVWRSLRFLHLGLGLFSFIFGQDCGCISQEITVRFLTIQEGTFKILVSDKQSPSQHRTRRPHLTRVPGNKAPLNFIVVCFHTLSSLPDLENDREPALLGFCGGTLSNH